MPHQDLTIHLLKAQAEKMFTATADLRILDAHRGRDSDVFFGRCNTLAELGLIDPSRAKALDNHVRELVRAYYNGVPK